MLRPTVSAAVVLAAGALAQPALAAPQTSQAAAESFLAAINRHDAQGACAQMLPRAQRAVSIDGPPHSGTATCAQILDALYHGVTENGDTFRRFTDLRHERPWHEGSFVGEQFSTLVAGNEGHDSDRSWLTIWMTRAGNGWLVAKSNAVIEALVDGSAGSNPFANDPPADPVAVASPAALPRPGFRCAAGRTIADPAGDDESYAVPLQGTPHQTHAPWLDLRAARVGRACVGVQLGSPLRPGTSISVGYEKDTGGGGFTSDAELAGISVDGQGEPWGYSGSDVLKPGTGFGVDGSTVWLRIPRLPKGAQPLVCVSSTLSVEPFLDVTVAGSDGFASRGGC